MTAASIFVGTHWHERASELSFVLRSLAGAASRSGPVRVLAPGTPGQQIADGAFDVELVGEAGSFNLPSGLDAATVVVDALSDEVAALLANAHAGRVLSLSNSLSHAMGAPHGLPQPTPNWERLRVVPDSASERDLPSVPTLPVYVPVNPLARVHRHHGFGFTGYLLVLSDGTGQEPDGLPAAAAWLTAAFTDVHVVVVHDAVAAAWKGRALRGRTGVDTRMDLWRLLAHASVCVDLAPGPLIARECVEALRFGTPVVVPTRARAGAAHARAAAGATFDDEFGLLAAVEALRDGATHERVSAAGQRYADAHHGDPAALVTRMRRLLESPDEGGSVHAALHYDDVHTGVESEGSQHARPH